MNKRLLLIGSLLTMLWGCHQKDSDTSGNVQTFVLSDAMLKQTSACQKFTQK